MLINPKVTASTNRNMVMYSTMLFASDLERPYYCNGRYHSFIFRKQSKNVLLQKDYILSNAFFLPIFGLKEQFRNL